MNVPALFPPRALWRASRRNLLRHALQSALMVLGIALGVAVVVSIDLANASAGRAFDLSATAVAGKATHQISGGPTGLADSLYTRLRTSGLGIPLAPVISQTVSSLQLGGRPLQLLGVDPFAEGAFRDYLGGDQGPALDQLTAFLTRPGAVLISSEVAARYGLGLGAPLDLDVGGRAQPAFVAGLLTPTDGLSRQTLDGLVLADIATAQELTGRIGRIDHIDVILSAGDAGAQQRLQALLPAGAVLAPAAARSGAIAEMTAAFRINLTALSLLALVVGLFLIYNTMTFTAVQRRPFFATLRCLGVTRREILTLVLAEALLVGVVGAGLGVALGVLMGRATVRMVTQTVNDLYFATTVLATGLPAASLVKGGLLGIGATLLTAVAPAAEAAATPPAAALSRSGLEEKARRRAGRAWWIGLAFLAAGAGIFVIPTRSIPAGFAGTLAVVLGFALFSGPALVGLMRIASPLAGKIFGMMGRMAPRSLVNALSRTSIAVAALMVAVAVTIGVGLMIDSFRHTVVVWLAETLQGDVYISTPSYTATQPGAPLDPAVVAALRAWPGVARVDLLRSAVVDSPDGPLQVSATDNVDVGNERLYAARDLPPEAIWPALERGAVLVSEPLANRLGIPHHGGAVTLDTESGPQSFPVVGVYYDYTSSQGAVLMALDVYRQHWADPAVTSAGLRLAPGGDAAATAAALQDGLEEQQQLVIRANATLRRDVLAVFDRTFAITGALQLLATIVAFIGVLSALLTLELEKQREAGILRAIGLTARQLWGLVMLETGLMGATAGLLALPTGYALAWILVYVINRRSFGWTLQMQLTPGPFLQALAVAVIAALLAGIYPARRLGRMAAAEAIRYE